MPNRAVTNAAIEAERRLRATMRERVERLWASMPGHLTDEDLERWLDAVLPLVDAGQRASIVATEGYLARAMGQRPPGLDRDEILAGVRNGATNREVYERPIVSVRAAVSEGRPYLDAVAAGAARASSTVATDMQLTFRGTAEAAQSSGLTPYGFERVADGDACEFCQMIDGAFVKDAGAMALHNNCGCGLEPLEAPHPRAASSRVPSGVAVHNHGELGPVIADPSHSFTKLGR